MNNEPKKTVLRDDPFYNPDSDETRMTLTPLSDYPGMERQHLPLQRLATSKEKRDRGWTVGHHAPWFKPWAFVYISMPQSEANGIDGFPDDFRTLLAGVPADCWYRYTSRRGEVVRVGVCIRRK